ncbi:hypothetical protein CA13_73570 [Planctomycetes bacterium CA13]|uniref:Uncharacterized protein n=1 Tax=Novipirellula herctigrandis TaxID=2527986 RepID=A0A5C5YLK2_9BACT|nr:hypothetical protein CA13_73570 [Planctomycetes bacterium CA13]
MRTLRPKICDHPLVQADDLRFYVSDRLRDDNIDLYSAFLLAHEALRIGRNGYLQPAWNYNLSISGLLRIFTHCLAARAFRADSMAMTAETWLVNDASHLQEHRPHFFTDRLSEGRALITDGTFLESLSQMREQYDSLNDDDGPFHLEVFPWHYAAPERELLIPHSQARFRNTTPVDPEVSDLIADLRRGQWA